MYAVSNITGDNHTMTLRPGAGMGTTARLIINARAEFTDKVLAWRFLQPGRPNPTHRFNEVTEQAPPQ